MKAEFFPEQPNRVWCTDFTYMTLTNGTMRYSCSIIDLYDRSIVASENSSFITSSLAVRTLEIAL
ncbi:DDE-type integrase/transposase/recombinase [Stomatobaculum longum]|uniref:DDE-type integrase/transposase/recombinase n=1 Tax=Stomatobaculum longum TaxID=796942 RepID=UPI003FA6A4BA